MNLYERAALLVDLQLALRGVAAETWRAMLKPHQADDVPPEAIAASAVLEYLEQLGWTFQPAGPQQQLFLPTELEGGDHNEGYQS